jgi:hypothetical protein
LITEDEYFLWDSLGNNFENSENEGCWTSIYKDKLTSERSIPYFDVEFYENPVKLIYSNVLRRMVKSVELFHHS